MDEHPGKAMDVADWAMLTAPPDKPWIPAPHFEEINRRLMRVMTGECTRLIIEAPPRHGKTETVCQRFTSLYLQTFPRRKVGLASYAAHLATKSCRITRDLTGEFGPRTFGYGVHPQDCSEADWSLVDRSGRPTGGGMRAVGVGGGMLGFGFDLLIVDDPINADDSASPTVRQNCWEWWKGTAMDRLNPGGKSAIIVMMQRLNEADLVGRLKAEEPDVWEVLTLRAEAEEDDILGRRPGEYLWPLSWGGWPNSFYEHSKGDPFWWATKYQQRPFPRGGGKFQTDWIVDNAVVRAPEGVEERVRFWDFAATEGGGDFTVGALLARKDDQVYIEDVRRGQWGSGKRDRIIREVCEADNKRHPFGVKTWGEEQPGAAGKTMSLAFKKLLIGYSANTELASGSKEDRADGLASAFSTGNVHACRGEGDNGPTWYRDLIAELSSFPAGKHDDIVDACSGAFNKLSFSRPAYAPATMSDAEYEAEFAYGGAA